MFVQGTGNFQPVNGLNNLEKFRSHLCLVTLEMTNEVELQG